MNKMSFFFPFPFPFQLSSASGELIAAEEMKKKKT